METVNMPGSTQPAAARCAACFPHHRTPSFVPTILWQGCIPQGAHPTSLPAPFPAPPPARCHLGLCRALMVGVDGQGEAFFRFPSLGAELCLAQTGHRGLMLEAGMMLQSDVM